MRRTVGEPGMPLHGKWLQAPGTMFIMLEKIRNAKLPSVFRLIASARIIYNDFSYMAQTRAELVLEASQTENNMGFVAAVERWQERRQEEQGLVQILQERQVLQGRRFIIYW